MEWRQEVTDAHEFMDSMKTDVFKDQVFAFTPQGDVVDLPAGATPIDFAYAVHTELGNRCWGANVNGRLVPLNYKFKNGDQVMVLAAKRGGEENVHRGRQMLEKEMRRLSVTQSAEALSKLFN
jgi:guanosine-3',5'-bis(diphosphate) 3'-pyrophosphohydrolase